VQTIAGTKPMVRALVFAAILVVATDAFSKRVRTYVKKDGTIVTGHYRKAPKAHPRRQ
jgi:hypothetical protein